MSNYDFAYDPVAKKELQEAFQWYRRRSSQAAADFLNRAEEVINQACKRPQSGRPARENIRKHTLKKFPYDIYYELIDERITILAIAHHARGPDFLAERLGNRE